MKLVLSHTTALDLLRAYRCGAPFDLIRTRATSLSDSAHTKAAIGTFEIPVFQRSDKRLHVLVPNAKMLCDSTAHVSHLATYSLPNGSLMQVGGGAYVVSASLLFLQFGTQMKWLQLALLGLEFCGKYSLYPAGASGMARSVPIVRTDELMEFVEKVPHARGSRTAREALCWVSDFSASPMESAIYLLLTLPVRRGGYGLPRPEMNPPTPLGSRNSSIMRVDDLHCDLHWRKAHIALEYNSKDSHVGHLTHDALRANALTSEGERVYTMTPAILANPESCDVLVSQIARELGHRLQGNALGASSKRVSLRGELFPWIS